MPNDLYTVMRTLNPMAAQFVYDRAHADARSFNCFGFVAYMMGWTPKLGWIGSRTQSEELLETYTVPIDEAEIRDGDIVTYSCLLGINHIAIIVDADKKLIIEKCGMCEMRLRDYRDSDYGRVDEFRRTKT